MLCHAAFQELGSDPDGQRLTGLIESKEDFGAAPPAVAAAPTLGTGEGPARYRCSLTRYGM